MEKITQYVCKELLISTNNSKLIVASILAVVGAGSLLLEDGVNVVSIIGFTVIVLMVVCLCVWQKWRDNKLKNNQFYIAEDIFLSVKRRKAWLYFKRYENCTLKFTRNGTYSVNIFEKMEPEKASCDYGAANFSKHGDKFYVLVMQGKKKNKILKCFNARFYEIFKEDFDYKDGKYYPR